MTLENDDFLSPIQEILSERLFVDVSSPDADLLQAGLLDSLALIQLLVHLEERFGVKISLDELEIEDLRSIRSVARLVALQKNGSPSRAAKSRPNEPGPNDPGPNQPAAVPVHG